MVSVRYVCVGGCSTCYVAHNKVFTSMLETTVMGAITRSLQLDHILSRQSDLASARSATTALVIMPPFPSQPFFKQCS